MDQMHPAPQASQAPQSPHKKSDSTTLILIIVGMIVFGVVAVAIIGALVAYVLTQTVSTIVEEADIDGIVDVIEEEIDEETGVGAEEVDNGETIVDESAGALAINWVPVAEQQYSKAEGWALAAATYPDQVGEGYLEVGTVKNGAYQGYSIRTQAFSAAGLGETNKYVVYLADPKGISKPIILDRYGSEVYGFGAESWRYFSVRDLLGDTMIKRLGDRVVFSTELTISDFVIAETIRDTQGRTYELMAMWTVLFERPDSEVVFAKTTDGYTIYRAEDEYATKGRFYIVREDGRAIVYALNIPFWEDEKKMVARPEFSFMSEGATGEYAKGFIGGCGFENPINVVEDVSVLGKLKKVDVTGGYSIYVPEDLNNEFFRERYENWIYNGDKSFEDFAAITPFFYWQDQIGRWLEFIHVDVLPQAECGKPVIYLYPEETMDVDVTVEPRGGFTFTEPAYNDGWSVTAKPNGQLRNKADGKTYPYLFWEGRGGLYQAPEEYWVVEQKEVKRFLKTTLAQYGLNRQEIADFNEFWVPRMKEAEFYKIGFHGTAVMDEIAPLTVSGGPDSIFRILMDFEELEAPVEANPPKNIVPFERVGFTVVEWGGVIE